MPKLLVMRGGKILSEWSLEEREIVIGRGSDCGIRVDDPSVSRHHAKVSRIYSGYFVEDLHSTNGVLLNGRRIRKRMLKDGDVVQIGTQELCYRNEEGDDVLDTDKTVVLSLEPGAAPQAPRQRMAAPPPSERPTRAYVRFLSGPEHGVSRLVDRTIYTIGQPGGNLAVISRRAHGHVLLHLGGSVVTTLNGKEVHGAGVKLNSGDRIQVGDTELEFHTE